MVNFAVSRSFYRIWSAPERMAALFKRGSRAMRSAGFLLVVTKTWSSSSSLGACECSPFQCLNLCPSRGKCMRTC